MTETKPRWYWFIPMFGRLAAYIEMASEHPSHKRVIILFENTLAYFFTGLIAGIMDPYNWLWIALILLIGLPIEYHIIIRKPSKFWATKIPSVKGFLWMMYHATCFLYLGMGLVYMSA